MLSDVVGWSVSECSGRPILIFFVKENWICAMTRHHANNILLARNLPFDTDVNEVKPSFNDTTALFCGLNRTIERMVALNMTCLNFFLFLFDFVHSHARCGCSSIVCLHF